MTGLLDVVRRAAPGRRRQGAARAVWNGAVLAESDHTIRLEGNDYFPRESLRAEHFRESSHHTVCAWKGVASYYTLEVGGERNEAAAWYYPSPSPAASRIKGYVAFWQGVDVVRA